MSVSRQIMIRISDDLLAAIDEKANEEVRSRSNMIIKTLTDRFMPFTGEPDPKQPVKWPAV